MTLLGAVLAGGGATRFGSDKALATLRGRTLIDHARAALAPLCAEVVVCGRAGGLPDRPLPGLGPLGGIAAALHHAAARGHAAVLTIGCDTPDVPPDLLARLAAMPGAAAVRDLPVLARWPATLAPLLDAQLAGGGSRAIRRFAEAAGATWIDAAVPLANVNTRADLAALA